MSRGLVLLVNPNKVHPPIAPYALDVLTTSLEAADFEVEVLDLTFHREDWKSCLAEYFAERDPMLVGVTVRNTDTVYAFEQRPFVGEHKEIITEIKRLTGAPVVVSGIGFSTMPFALVDYFGIDYGVKGPGERIICDLADALLTGRDPGTVPGLLRNTGAGVTRVPCGGADRAARAGAAPLAHRGVRAPGVAGGRHGELRPQVGRGAEGRQPEVLPARRARQHPHQERLHLPLLALRGAGRQGHLLRAAGGDRGGRRDGVAGRAGDPRPAHHRQRVQPVGGARQERAAGDRPPAGTPTPPGRWPTCGCGSTASPAPSTRSSPSCWPRPAAAG